jgi:hypothetical protein
MELMAVLAKSEIVMRTKEFQSLEEKRAYYRLLRHLLTEKLQDSYKQDQARPLPPRIVDLLKTLEACKPPGPHQTRHEISRKDAHAR